MEPHTTNVPAEKNPINKDRPLMYHGMVPLAAKKDCMLFTFSGESSPTRTTPRENSTIVMMSRVVISNDLVNKTGLKNLKADGKYIFDSTDKQAIQEYKPSERYRKRSRN